MRAQRRSQDNIADEKASQRPRAVVPILIKEIDDLVTQ